MSGWPYDYLSMLTVDALVEGETDLFIAARLGGVVELTITDSDGSTAVATLYPEEAFDLQRRILVAATVAANRRGNRE